jgi:hypothetical protein
VTIATAPPKEAVKVQFASGPDYLKLPRAETKWIVEGLLPVSGLLNWYGHPKTGKSFGVMGMAMAITNGHPTWLGMPVRLHGPVAYVQVDTPREEWADRLQKLQGAGYCIDQLHIADMQMVPYPYNVLDQGHLDSLRRQLEVLRPLVVVIDTLRESFAGDENDSSTMRQVVNNIVSACRPSAVILLSHQRKDGASAMSGGEDLMNDNRGSGYVAGRMDVVVKQTKKSLIWEGRAVKHTRLAIERDEIGLVILASNEEMEQRRARLRELVEQHPTLSKNKLAALAAPQLNTSEATVKNDLDVLFPERWKKGVDKSGVIHPPPEVSA